MNDKKIEELIKALGDSNSVVRENAAEALGNIGAPAVEPLIKALRDEDWCVRMRAAEALGKIGDAQAVEPLIRVLGDRDYRVRGSAVEALEKIGNVRAVEPFVRLLGDNNSYVRWRAAKVLGKLHWSPVNNTEKVYYLTAKQDWKSITQLGAPAVEPLILALEDFNLDVIERAAKVLGKIGDVRAVEPLIRTLRSNYYPYVRETAAKALWKIGVPAVEPLIRALGDGDSYVRKNATDTITKIYSQITEIIFGEIPSNNTRTCVKNLETSQLTIPMSGLTKILIDADTYDFDIVERFITYAINYVGQKHLRKKVEVSIYGNPDKLHPNLLNSFKNLCKKVVMYS